MLQKKADQPMIGSTSPESTDAARPRRDRFSRGPGPITGTERKRERGQSLLELTAVTPFLIMLTIVAIDFGGWLYCWTQVGNAARAVANYEILGPSSAGGPATPNAAAITSLIADDLAALPNYSSTNPTVAVCWNANGVVQTITGTCGTPTADPEPASFIAVSVDLTYTFTPFIGTFSFPNLGVKLPSLPTSIHRHVVMRYI